MSSYEANKSWADKVVLLALFVISLLIARFIVFSRSSIVLSEPIELRYGGLSVSVPTGNGWQKAVQWNYQQNAFILGSFFTTGSDNVSAIVSCRYELAPEAIAPETMFRQKASAVGGLVVETGRIKTGRPSLSGDVFIVEWAHIEGRATLFDTFFGIVQLSSNHRFTIEVHQAIGDTTLAEQAFKFVAESLKFTDTRLLEDGSEIVAEIKNKGLNSFLSPDFPEGSASNGHSKETFFLIKDARGRLVGFTMEVLGSHFASMPETPEWEETKTRLNMLAGSFYYIRGGRYDHRQLTIFQSDDNFDEFLWKNETQSPGGRTGAEMVMGRNKIMTVKTFDGRMEESIRRVGFSAIPDILSELIFRQMLDSNRDEIFVDIIGADSKIIPTLITSTGLPPSIGRGGGPAFAEETAYAFSVKLLDGRGFSEQVYLDDEMQILGRLLQQKSTYIMESTSVENILREFPEHGRYILRRRDELFEPNQPLEDGK